MELLLLSLAVVLGAFWEIGARLMAQLRLEDHLSCQLGWPLPPQPSIGRRCLNCIIDPVSFESARGSRYLCDLRVQILLVLHIEL